MKISFILISCLLLGVISTTTTTVSAFSLNNQKLKQQEQQGTSSSSSSSCTSVDCVKVVADKCPGPDSCKKVTSHCSNSSSSSVKDSPYVNGCFWIHDEKKHCPEGCKKARYSCSTTVFKQCGEKWSSQTMGSNGDSICSVGCLMSSVSEALFNRDIRINGSPANPGTLNEFNHANGCYLRGTSELLDACIDKIAPHRISFRSIMKGRTSLSLHQINEWLKNDPAKVIIANVLSGQHFVLITGVDTKKEVIYVADPGFNRWEYSYKEGGGPSGTSIVGYNIWDMK